MPLDCMFDVVVILRSKPVKSARKRRTAAAKAPARAKAVAVQLPPEEPSGRLPHLHEALAGAGASQAVVLAVLREQVRAWVALLQDTSLQNSLAADHCRCETVSWPADIVRRSFALSDVWSLLQKR